MKVKLFVLILSMGFTLTAKQRLADRVKKILMQTIPDKTRAYNMVMQAMYTEAIDI